MIRRDTTGQRFGHLTVLKELGNGKIFCRCDCGNEKVFNKQNVTSGKSTSCGCARKDRIKSRKNIAGQRFGRLTAIKPVGKKDRSILWLCRCDCGNIINVSTEQLQSGVRKSCGCLEKESRQAVMKAKYFDHTNIAKIASRKPYANNKTGVRGVSMRNGRYLAQIKIKGKNIRLGSYSTLEEAAAARRQAESRYFGEILEKYIGLKEK